MSKFFTTVQEFLAKFDTVKWIGQDRNGDKLLGKLETGEDISFSLYTEFANNHHDIDGMPVQVIARVSINGVYASSWGATELSDCSALVRYYRVNEARAQQIEYGLDKEAKELAKEQWELL